MSEKICVSNVCLLIFLLPVPPPPIILIVVVVAEVEVVQFGGQFEGLEVDSVSQDAADAAESSTKLRTFLGFVGDNLQGGAEALVLVGEPFQQRHGFDQLQLDAGFFVDKVGFILFLVLIEMKDLLLVVAVVLEHVTHDLQVLPHDEDLHSAHLERFERVVDAEAEFARVLRDLVEIFSDQLLFLDEFHVG